MTVHYVAQRVKGLSIACIAHCMRCGRPYAAGSEKDVRKVVEAMKVAAFLREKPKHTHCCPRCKDEMVARFLARCGSQRKEIAEELRLIRQAPSASVGGAP